MMGILPVVLFSNGHTFYVQHLQDRLDQGLEPYAVHATFQYGLCPPEYALVWDRRSPAELPQRGAGKCVQKA